MIKKTAVLAIMTFTILLSSCTSTNVLNAWKADNAPSIKTKNTLVIVRTNNKKARMAFENAIAKELRKVDIQATESYKSIPELRPNKKLTETELEDAKKMLRDASFNAVVLTVLKDKKTLISGEYTPAHRAGDSFSNYFPIYYGNFYSYYFHPNSYLTGGTDVEESFVIQESTNYVLETLAFNLDEPSDKQLVASVTANLEEPSDAIDAARQYANKIVSALKQKK